MSRDSVKPVYCVQLPTNKVKQVLYIFRVLERRAFLFIGFSRSDDWPNGDLGAEI